MESAAVHPLDLAIHLARNASTALTLRESAGEIAVSLSVLTAGLADASDAAEKACADPDGRLAYLRSKVDRAANVYRTIAVDDRDHAAVEATLRDVIDSCQRIQRR